MNLKNLRCIYELSKNSRITSKGLGKRTRLSQQSASYLTKAFEKKGIIKGYIIGFDTSRFGLINIGVLLRVEQYNSETRNRFEKYLLDHQDITYIETLSTVWDYFIILSVPNISYFNKRFKTMLSKFEFSRFIVLPIIVKHMWNKKYIKNEQSNTIMFGDREKIELTEKENNICEILSSNPRTSLVELARKSHMDIKTAAKIKKKLDTIGIIKFYSTLIDHEKANIYREIVLLKLKDHSIQADKKILEFCSQNKNIISLIKMIGEWDLLLFVEMYKQTEFLSEFREKTTDIIQDYQTCNSIKVLKDSYLPDAIFNKE